MHEVFIGGEGKVAIFSDDGIVLYYTLERKKIRRYYPYGSIKSINVDVNWLGGFLEVTGNGIAENGDNFQNVFSVFKIDAIRLEKSVDFAKSKIQKSQNQKVEESGWNNAAESERILIHNAAKQHSNRREQRRIKNRNIGLIIMILSISAILIACTSTRLAALAIISVFVGFIGFLIFAHNIKPPENLNIKAPKPNSGTKEIVKGAVIGSIVAGDVGAVVGAVAAKNKIDNQKK